MQPRYLWRPGSRVPAGLDAQTAGETLESIRLANGDLTPALVVEASRTKGAPLHAVFEWDNKKAANKYREVQAGNIIRAVAVSFERGDEVEPLETRAFVSVEHEEESRSYTSITVAMADPSLRVQVVEQAKRELRAWRERYSRYDELAQIFAALEKSDMAA